MSIKIRRDGRIWSLKKRKYITGSFSRKYLAVWTGTKREYIHRLVALKYIPNPENKRTVNHIDGNPKNNHMSNLEWATHGENTKHAYDNNMNTCSEYQKEQIRISNRKRRIHERNRNTISTR